jgi:ankyrin repeat protein
MAGYRAGVTADLTPEELELLQSAFDHARNGDVDALTELLDAGLPANLTNSKGDTLLILAAYHQHADLVRLLLARGADHARINDNGQTALAAAVFRQQEQIVTDLLGAGADPELGPRSAVAIARFFDLPQMLALLDVR